MGCEICGGEIAGGDLTVWEASGGERRVFPYAADVPTSEGTVKHAVCVLERDGVDSFIALIQSAMVDYSKSLHSTFLRLDACERKLREHRLTPP